MTHPFFCSDVSRQVGEDLIGSATPYQTFILVECPFPWTPVAFDSKWIPQNLRDLVAFVKAAGLPIRFLLINQGLCKVKKNAAESFEHTIPTTLDDELTHVLIYQRSSTVFSQGYQRYEWLVNQPEEIAPLIQSYLSGQPPLGRACHRPVRDLLVCVHGSHDKCCAKYGFPFYREAIATMAQLKEQLKGQPIRLWQTSHFGGHRFAPTLIDFPTGRYYGRMNQSALQTLLTQSGDLQDLDATYRGWSVLPTYLQAAERELMRHYGWPWFDYKIAYQLISESADHHSIQAKLSVMRSTQEIHSYAVEVVKDDCKTVCLRISCGASQESEQVSYTVKSIIHLNSTQSMLKPLHHHVCNLSL
jgi:hypothetical protein